MAELASKFNIGCVIQYYSDQWYVVGNDVSLVIMHYTFFDETYYKYFNHKLARICISNLFRNKPCIAGISETCPKPYLHTWTDH